MSKNTEGKKDRSRLSLFPLTLDEAITDLLKVKPPQRERRHSQRKEIMASGSKGKDDKNPTEKRKGRQPSGVFKAPSE